MVVLAFFKIVGAHFFPSIPFVVVVISVLLVLQEVCSGQRIVLGNQRFPVRVRLLAMCRGELSAVLARLMSKCLRSGWKW